jgi:hypothetical protein
LERKFLVLVAAPSRVPGRPFDSATHLELGFIAQVPGVHRALSPLNDGASFGLSAMGRKRTFNESGLSV